MGRFSLLALRLRKLFILLRYSVLRRAFIRYFVMAGVEHGAVLMRNLSTVVDIGANRGQFALAARAMTHAKIFSFEPLPEVAQLFARVFEGDTRVKLYTAAIGERKEKGLLHLSASDDSSSLLEIGAAQASFFPGTHEVGTLEVEVGRLEDFLSTSDIESPALLKLDVQGSELKALAGCGKFLDHFDYIYCECSFVVLYKGQSLADEVIEYLRSVGFKVIGIYNPSYDRDGNSIQADFLFEKIAKTSR